LNNSLGERMKCRIRFAMVAKRMVCGILICEN
jgi:hypothetical protein